MRKAPTKASRKPPPPRAPSRERGRHRVAALTAAAAALFLEKGYEAATMTEIASRAGAAIGTLYLFFPTKEALAHAMLSELADDLSGRIEALHIRMKAKHPIEIADALFAVLAEMMATHPVYAVLADSPKDETWTRAIRAKRRDQIAALLEGAKPTLPKDQAERLAVILPQLMRIALTVKENSSLRAAIMDELRLMLRHHLET